MTNRVPESDWRVFRDLREVALQRFCERVLGDLGRLCADVSKSPHERYLAVYRWLQDRDREMAIAFNDPKRSQTIPQLAAIHGHNLLEPDELSRFTPQTRNMIGR